ncbi:MAG TPA: hypothetical protein QF480_07585 [Bacteroidales bacterium]|nr:hypothetical protein [Bacteroidales bacterium]
MKSSLFAETIQGSAPHEWIHYTVKTKKELRQVKNMQLEHFWIIVAVSFKAVMSNIPFFI